MPSDGTTLSAMVGGDTIATDDLSTLNGGAVTNVKAERVKVGYGSDGSLTDVDATHGLPVSQAGTTAAAITQVSASATNVTLLASNASARARKIYNDSTAVLYVKFGATASKSSYTTQIEPQTLWPLPTPLYTGRIDALWTSANGSALVTEET